MDEQQVRRIVREELSRLHDDDKLTITQAAAASGFSAATISRWIKTGRLKKTGSGKETRIRRADLDAAVGAHSTPEEAVDAEIQRRVDAALKRRA